MREIAVLMIPIFIIVYCISTFKHKDYLGNLLFSIGLAPLICMLFFGLYVLIRDGILSSFLTLAAYALVYGVFLLLAIGLIILSQRIIKKRKETRENKPLRPAERITLIILIVISSVYLLYYLFSGIAIGGSIIKSYFII